MTSPTTAKPKQSGLTKTFLALLGRSSAEQQEAAKAAQPHLQASGESRADLSRLKDERARLRGLHNTEIEKQAEIEAQLQAVEAERIEALADHRVSGDAKRGERAQELLAKASALRQDISDASAVAARIQSKIDALKPEIESAMRSYRVDFGKFLENQMAAIAAEYRDQAEKVAEITVTIAALQAVMVRYGCGNSNGFWGNAHVPQIIPGDGRVHEPFLDAGSRRFGDLVPVRASELINELAEQGFPAPDR
jgi:hypothetical protein